MGPKETFLTTKEFASRSGLTVAAVTQMLRDKRLKGQKQSGRWMIPASALQTAGEAPPAPAKKSAPPAKPAPAAPGGRHLTVAEFSQRTYLTEAGVIQWLKKGRLRGIQTAVGEWQIDAASLELPVIKHLLRS
jgi:hypothetical protein